ncbi:uncharacterized protein PV09_08216 [Verruconis gallopava]|uniref:Replication factor A protein 3 n=1 Tax=Verruconis gallopava TaxID=253628 RepID=A0A0D2A1G7_9PEZI|nr:uncharacterized protein PV09_08216 [Verruconis gallopava]KIW00175.1 hypothetical protein PV09_08216 [Verruconis gallopava]
MADESTPRINASYLESFQGQRVRFVGKVVRLQGDRATVDCAGQITLILNRDSHLVMNHAFEIVGQVTPDLSVRVNQALDFGTDFDFNAYEAVVNATHRHKEIFYGADM